MDSTTSPRRTSRLGLVQAPSRRVRLEASELRAEPGFLLKHAAGGEPAQIVEDGRIHGTLRFVEDRIGAAGAGDSISSLPLTARPLPETAAPGMLLMIEAGDGEAEFVATFWVPPPVFASLRRDVEAGLAHIVTLTATTGLWLSEADRARDEDGGVTWRLVRDDDGDIEPARGLVERIGWSAPVSVAAGPIPTVEDEEPPETAAEVLARLNWTMRLVALILVFLLIVIALK